MSQAAYDSHLFVQNFFATIASTQLARSAREEGRDGPASAQLATMDNVRSGECRSEKKGGTVIKWWSLG